MQKIKYIFKYINYLQKSENKFDVHPPFLFDLITDVFEDKNSYPACRQIEQLKSSLLQKHETIEVNDLGAGSVADNKHIRTVKSITKHSSKQKKYGRLLYRLSRYFEPENILELGTAMGISTAYMALGNKSSTLSTIEGCKNISKLATQNMKTLDIQNVKVINGNFDDLLPRYLASVPRLDMVFIDGNHLEKPTINYFEQCLLKTVNTSCFIFDDIHWSDGMDNAWNYIRKHQSVTLSIDLFFMGIVFFRKELSKQHFVIRF